MENKISCPIINCVYCQKGYCVCQGLVKEAKPVMVDSPLPGVGRSRLIVLCCASHSLKRELVPVDEMIERKQKGSSPAYECGNCGTVVEENNRCSVCGAFVQSYI